MTVVLDRRSFMTASGAMLLAGCSSGSDRDLPEPVQMDREPWQVAAGMLGLASISARVMVLSRMDYPTDASDVLSAVSPMDLAVAWGPAAREPALQAVMLTQSDRRYNWKARTSDMAKPGVGTFTRHSGNWHMIPASPVVSTALKRVKREDIVWIEGDLVQVSFTNGVYFRSSLVRDDTGDGACEIVRVRSIEIERS